MKPDRWEAMDDGERLQVVCDLEEQLHLVREQRDAAQEELAQTRIHLATALERITELLALVRQARAESSDAAGRLQEATDAIDALTRVALRTLALARVEPPARFATTNEPPEAA